MSDAEFGDWEPGDSLDTEPADPEQVAVRLHELRAFLAASAGDELAAWDELPDDQREIGEALAMRLVEFLTADADHAHVELNDAIAWLSGQPTWDDLDERSQAVAKGLVDDIIEWLGRQGAMP